MSTNRPTLVTTPTVPVPSDTPTEAVSDDGHATPDTAAGHALPGWPGHGRPDMSTDTGMAVDPDMVADYFVERREAEGNAAAVTWTTIATGSVKLDQAGPDALEDFVDRMAKTARAMLIDGQPVRVSAMIRSSGYAAYTEVAAKTDPTTGLRRPRGARGVGRPADTQRMRRRTQRRGL